MRAQANTDGVPGHGEVNGDGIAGLGFEELAMLDTSCSCVGTGNFVGSSRLSQ
jgi:hypothetical protein